MPMVTNSDRIIKMEVVRELCENSQTTHTEDSSKQAVHQNLNGQIECKPDKLQKQNKFLMGSALDLLKAFFDLDKRHDIAMKTIHQLQTQLEKIEETASTQKAISNFEKMLQLAKLRKKIEEKQNEVTQLQNEIYNDSDKDLNMMIDHDDSLSSGSKCFIILCEFYGILFGIYPFRYKVCNSPEKKSKSTHPPFPNKCFLLNAK